MNAVESRALKKETPHFSAGRKSYNKPIHVANNKKNILIISVDDLGRLPKIFEEEVNNDKFGVQVHWSVALNLCYMACGRYDAAITANVNSWDIAAAALIAEESGAIVTDFDNKKWSVDRGYVIASSTKKMHKLLVTLVK